MKRTPIENSVLARLKEAGDFLTVKELTRRIKYVNQVSNAIPEALKRLCASGLVIWDNSYGHKRYAAVTSEIKTRDQRRIA